LGTNDELASVVVAGASPNLHYFAIRDGELYVAALGDAKVHRFTIQTGDDLLFRDSFDAASPASIAFSPAGDEMFTAGHLTDDVIDRFRFDAQNDTWIEVGTTTTATGLGGLLVLP